MFTHRNQVFRKTIIRPLWGAAASNFCVVQYGQGLLARMTSGPGVLLTTINDKNSKIGQKLIILQPITLGSVRITPPYFPYDVPGSRYENLGTHFFGDRSP